MKGRRKVISSGAMDVLADSSFDALPLVEDTQQASSLPSAPAPLNLFEKFRNVNSMFSEWLLPPEADTEAKPISDDIAKKLKDRNSSMNLSTAANGGVSRAGDGNASGASNQRAVADGFEDGEFFSFGPAVLSEKEAALSSMTSDNLQAVVTVSGNNAVAATDFSQRSYAQSKSWRPDIQRTVPLWSVERFQVAGGYCESNALIALHEEIMDLIDFLSPSQAEVSLRRYIELEITKMAKKLWPECTPLVYGSLTTGLLLPLSDVDMTILDVPVSTEEALTALSREVGNAGMCTTAFPQLILKTKVPLLKFTHRGSLLDVDVSINAGDGRVNSDIVKGYLAQYPEARPLVIVVKYFLQQREMHEPYHGGMGSFATTLLVISFLQHHPIYTTRPHERRITGLGKLLVDFFRYYGCCFNAHRCGVSLEHDGFYFIRRQQSAMDSGRGGMMNQVILEDPGNRSNNAASSLRQFPTIASSFAHAYAALTAVFPLINEGSGMSPDSEDIAQRPTILSRILHIDASSVARRRCIIETFEAYQSDASLSGPLSEVLAYCRVEDAPMIRRAPLSKALAGTKPAPPILQAPPQAAQTPDGYGQQQRHRGSAASSPTARGAPQLHSRRGSPTLNRGSPTHQGNTQNRRRDRDAEPNACDDNPRRPRPARVYQRPNY